MQTKFIRSVTNRLIDYQEQSDKHRLITYIVYTPMFLKYIALYAFMLKFCNEMFYRFKMTMKKSFWLERLLNMKFIIKIPSWKTLNGSSIVKKIFRILNQLPNFISVKIWHFTQRQNHYLIIWCKILQNHLLFKTNDKNIIKIEFENYTCSLKKIYTRIIK